MLYSMTGFGKAVVELSDKKVIIEIKSLNSKNIDTNIKVPQLYREKEMFIRKWVQEHLKRGKIDFSLYYELNEGLSSARINPDVFKAYFSQISVIEEELKLESTDKLATILRLPDVINNEKPEINEEEWLVVSSGIQSALADIQKFRLQEGEFMAKDLRLHVENIIHHLNSIEPYENERITRIRERITKSLEELKLSESADQNRFEQELIYYLEKLDISEEKTRLRNHCTYFLDTLDAGEEAGKKLSFISQEMGREINTLGSKASESKIQHIVVKMKDELEKIKEQCLNIL